MFLSLKKITRISGILVPGMGGGAAGTNICIFYDLMFNHLLNSQYYLGEYFFQLQILSL